MSDNHEKNAYAILGIPKGSSPDEIKQAYLSLVRKYDPEKHTDRFIVIQKAFDKLKDPATRAKEDIGTFNYIRGELLFTDEEKVDKPDDKIDAALSALKARRDAGEIPAAQANQMMISGLMMRSWKKSQKKVWNEAIADWQEVLALDPTHRRAKNNLFHAEIMLGYTLAQHGLNDEAVEIWADAVRMDPNNSELIQNLALACELAGRFEESDRYWKETVKRWREQLEREPDNEYLKNCVIEILRRHGEQGAQEGGGNGANGASAANREGAPAASAPKGIAEYREILKLTPNDFEAHFKLSSLLMQQKSWGEAAQELEEITKKFPRNVEVLNLLGWAYLNGGKHDEAFTVWRKAQVIDPKSFQIRESLIKAHMAMGRMLREKGHYTPSLVHFKALMRFMPENDEVHYEVARTYQLKGDERSAFIEYQKALQLNPKHKLARNGLSSLKLRR